MPHHIHAIFDVLAWMSALGVRFILMRSGDFSVVQMSPAVSLRYKVVLLLGASIGALLSGSFNLMMQYHNKGLGQALLRDAMIRAVSVSADAGVFAILVHALSDQARQFYLSRGLLNPLATNDPAHDA